MSSYSSHKGNGFENKVLRECRAVWPMSHKSIGSGNAKDDSGDIFFGEKFLIECKFHKKLTRKQLNDFWTKIRAEAEDHKRVPLLVFKENNRDAMVMFENIQPGDVDISRGFMYWDEFVNQLLESKEIRGEQ